MQDYQEMNKAWDEWVDSHNTPTRATVQSQLADPKWKVEIVIGEMLIFILQHIMAEQAEFISHKYIPASKAFFISKCGRK